MKDRAQVKVVDLEGAEVAFHLGQAFVGGDHAGGIQGCGGHGGAQHIDAVQGGLGGDLGGFAGDGQTEAPQV